MSVKKCDSCLLSTRIYIYNIKILVGKKGTEAGDWIRRVSFDLIWFDLRDLLGMVSGRESLIRLVGKRRRFLPNRLFILSHPIPSTSTSIQALFTAYSLRHLISLLSLSLFTYFRHSPFSGSATATPTTTTTSYWSLRQPPKRRRTLPRLWPHASLR